MSVYQCILVCECACDKVYVCGCVSVLMSVCVEVQGPREGFLAGSPGHVERMWLLFGTL